MVPFLLLVHKFMVAFLFSDQLMKATPFLLLLSLFLYAPKLFAQHPPVFEGMQIDSTLLQVGEMDLSLIKYSYNEPNVRFLAIHDDEDTGVKAAFQFIQTNGGSIVDSQYGSVRNFKFWHEDEEFQTDPNGIYTEEGRLSGLEKYGAITDAAIDELEKASKTILKTYLGRDKDYMITLHNNADGGFGIRSYLPGYPLESVADSVHINFETDEDDMILVTDLKIYNLLKKENVNVILQAKTATDDGSLSIYAMQHHIPYLNIEVQHGHLEENLRLIELGVKALKEAYPQLPIKKPQPAAWGF